MTSKTARCPICRTIGSKSGLSHHIRIAHTDTQAVPVVQRKLQVDSTREIKSKESTPSLLQTRDSNKFVTSPPSLPEISLPQVAKVIEILAPSLPKTTRAAIRKEIKANPTPKRSFSRTKILVVQGTTERRMSEMKKPLKPTLGLGELVRNEGRFRGQQGEATPLCAKYSCQGENVNCFKCDGTGFYEKKMVGAVGLVDRPRVSAHPEITFSNDFRGGIYGVRENGRFESSPLEDDYDE